MKDNPDAATCAIAKQIPCLAGGKAPLHVHATNVNACNSELYNDKQLVVFRALISKFSSVLLSHHAIL